MRPFVRGVAVIAIAGATLSTGCVVASAATPSGRASVNIHATRHHNVAAPRVIAPGTVQVRNTGRHPIMVFRRNHAGPNVLVADLARRGPAKLMRDFTVVDFLNPRGNVYLHLTRGVYYLVDAAGEP